MALDSLLQSIQTRNLKFIFVGGKGGVGKTTSSSAIATLIANHCNKRVLLVSTDPAHSLSDAFRCQFSNEPSSPDIKNLDVMEVNPAEIMEKELQKWARLMKDLEDTQQSAEDHDGMVHKLQTFHEWLSGIPGIDEATALSSAITHIESNKYDIIVFDTAPTGHTIKLLGMPHVLQKGLDKLQSWQSTLWNYWEVLKGFTGSSNGKKRMDAKESIAKLLSDYKANIEKVACMLTDQNRTRFIVVCIAEYLSISETQRLLNELKRNKVKASHVIVNQLVVENALSTTELEELEGLAEVGTLQLNQRLLAKTVHACRLTTARKGIQEKYLSMLKSFEEVEDIEGICELPLLAEEVTGKEALVRFAHCMIENLPDVLKEAAPLNVNAGSLNKSEAVSNNASKHWSPCRGDTVRIFGLEKSSQYNDLEGTIVGALDPETNRCGVQIEYQGTVKTLALQTKNIELLHNAKKTKLIDDIIPPAAATSVKQNVSKTRDLLNDPEIVSLIDSNPKFRAAVEDVLKNPMNFVKYLADPEMSPLISKAMSKLKF
ncbi:hypothetical protein ACHAWO_013393 [Cyclotella atomus]|uniref:STI1 domain-containing protein n=1 Tax=Cyclotella atomus TaxID=382360 RepID=A0ABD3N637_9STRA